MSGAPAGAKVAILDRDGTLVIDREYLADAAGLEFLPGAAQGLRRLSADGYRLVVITNQSGVGRGYFPIGRVYEMNRRLGDMVRAEGARLAAIYFCPHSPEQDCDCRKPRQGLLRQASVELGFDPRAAVVIGDRESDIELGVMAGARTVLIAAEPASAAARTGANLVATDLHSAALALSAGGY